MISMLSVLTVVLLMLGAFYAALMFYFGYGFRRVIARNDYRSNARPFVSVVIPARDEAHFIADCVDAVLANEYPDGLFEVIVVDDLSRDGTVQAVRKLQERVNLVSTLPDDPEAEPERLRLLSMPENLKRTRAHKKRAIEKGISEARGEIILTTDADCSVGPAWIETMVSFFTEKTAFVSGPVLFHPQDRHAMNVQALEFLGLVAIGAGAIGVGRPNLCNGANVAYRRDVFFEMGGFSGIDKLTSGDDEMLMQKIAYETSWGVRFCPDEAAATRTHPAASLSGFFEQRRRWASKGAHYPNKMLVAVIAAIYAFYVLLLAAVPVAFAVPGWWPWLLAALGLKMAGEYSLLRAAAKRFGRGALLKYFLPAQILHIPYVVLMGAAGAMGGYKWKGRTIDR